MAPRAPSPPLIKGIDGIVSRSPNEVNYSTLNGKNMETRKQPGHEIRRKFKKYRLRQKERYYVKEEENDGKTKNLREPGNRNEIEVMKSDVESNGEEDGATSKAQPKKCENSTSNDNIENIFSKVTQVVEGLYNDQVEEAKATIATIAEVTRQEQERSHTWLSKHRDNFFEAVDELKQISAIVITLERKVKAVQVAAEKRMVTLRHGRCESLATKE